jgi:hypothetical protein
MDQKEEENGGNVAQPPPKTKVIEADSQSSLVAFSIAGYATCSSLMLVMNKVRTDSSMFVVPLLKFRLLRQVAVHVMPAPSFVLLMQLATSAISVWMAGQLGWVTVDKLEWKKVTFLFTIML